MIRNPVQLTLIFLFLFSLQGCGFGEWDVKELYAQKIEGTSKVLYKYEAWGGIDAYSSGYVILDSNRKFEVSPKYNLPFYYLLDVPGKVSVKGVSHVCNNSCGEDYKLAKPIYTPLRVEEKEGSDFKIINIIYQYKGVAERGGGYASYEFQDFKEARDSLWFYNLDEFEHGNSRHVDSLRFKKTNVYIGQDANDTITRIVIFDLIVRQPSHEIVSSVTYKLTPKTKLHSKSFSDYSIFKELVKKPK